MHTAYILRADDGVNAIQTGSVAANKPLHTFTKSVAP